MSRLLTTAAGLLAVLVFATASAQPVAVVATQGSGVASDGTPNSFSFTDQTDISLSSTITSGAVEISGIDITISCSATGGTVDVEADADFQSSRNVTNGQDIRARHTSSGSNSTATNTAVNCGGVSDTFTSTTEAAAPEDTSTACDDAATGGSARYLLSSASGANNGTSWTDAWTSLSTAESNLTRGQTLCVGDGSYGGATFNAANSGTTRITVKKATSADHGTETGWSSAHGDGQASFGNMWVQNGYFTFDGAVGGGPGDWDCSNCGFYWGGEHVFGQNCCTPPSSNDPNGIILRHTDLDGLNDDSGDGGRTLELWYTDDLLIEYANIRDSKCDLMEVTGVNDIAVQYTRLADNHQIVCHGDIFEHQIAASTEITVRWSYISDTVGSYGFGSHGPNIDGLYIYGNIFDWPTVDPVFGNHLVGTLSGSGAVLSNVKFYNNSLRGPFRDDDKGTPESEDDDITQVCIGGLGGGSGNEVRNNLWISTWLDAGDEYDCGMGGATATSNSGYEISGLNESLGSDPFTSPAGGDFTLTGASTAGTSLSSPYDEDMCGNTRGADGTWERGAMEFGMGVASCL